jgi:hypothetical protein
VYSIRTKNDILVEWRMRHSVIVMGQTMSISGVLDFSESSLPCYR